MLNDLAVEAVGLAKSFDGRSVLRGLSLAVPRGTVFCLLGPNGAGKTTMVRILATLARADSGTARVAGLDVVTDRREVRSRISLTGQYAAVDGAQTGAENVRMAGRLAGLSRKAARLRADELLGQFGLADAAGRRAATYSGGMRRRLDLAAGLVSRPEVMFLDEPTTGLDLPGRQAVWQVVGELARSGATIFLTTQYLEEADQLADRVAVLDGGVIVADDSPAALKQKVGGRELELELADETAYKAALTCLGQHVVRTEAERLVIGVATDGSGPAVRGLLDEVDPDRTRVRRFAVHDVSMDAVFLALTTPSARATSSIPEPEETCNV
jgi:ABC-2 type transport system ATP-binding protein